MTGPRVGEEANFVERPDLMDAVEKAKLETWKMDRLFGFRAQRSAFA
jgi:hypothetical protein